VRKRLVIVGHSREGLELVPLLEANPTVEICALVSDDAEAARAALAEIDPGAVRRLGARITTDVAAALATPGLAAVVDADAPASVHARLASLRGVQVTTPSLARMLYAFGPADAYSKPDLLQALREILDSADLTRDRRTVLDLVLQVAVSATGADRGSLMLWDERERALRVEVALGIEEEVISKIRVLPGEGIAGRAFAAERAILLHGKADRTRWQITRERDDVESAISAPLVHHGRVIGVLNLSHARNQNQFRESDLAFVEELARLDARIIARAEEYDGIVRESQVLRVEAQVRRLLAREEPLALRLQAVCQMLAEPLGGGVAELWLREPDAEHLVRAASSIRLDPLGQRGRLHPGEGLAGRAAQTGRPLWLAGAGGDAALRCAAVPFAGEGGVLGVAVLEGEVAGAAAELCARVEATAAALGAELAGELRSLRLEREARRRERLDEAVGAMAACRSADELWEVVVASAVSLLEAQDAVLRLREEATGRFRVAAWSGVGQWRQAPLAELERRLAGEAMRQRRCVRVADLSADPALAEHAVGVATAMAQPILHDDELAGSLAVLGKVPDDPLLGERFGKADEVLLERLVQHARIALAATFREPVRPDADPVTGLAAQRPLRERLAEEIERSRLRGHRLALLDLRFPGLEAPGRDAARDRIAIGLSLALRAGLRPFDVLARPAADRFVALVPEPEGDVTRILTDLCRRAREVLEVHGGAAGAAELRMGYALYPEDGADADALEARAAEARVEAL
jgi:GGDEF domain-containing protein/putative methionine-R-sulfoxide reductase with GAF domain